MCRRPVIALAPHFNGKNRSTFKEPHPGLWANIIGCVRAKGAAIREIDTKPSIITNRAPLTLTEFFYRPAGTTEWGLDRFGTLQLATNQSISFRISGAGMHDLRAVWSNNREARLDGVNFCETGLIVADERGLARR